MNKIDWEILDPKLNSLISNLTENVISLKNENRKLNNNIEILKEQIKNTNNIILEQTYLFNQMKDFLEDNRKRYTKSFNELNIKINKNKELNEKLEVKNNEIKENINKNKIIFNKNINDNKELNKKIFNQLNGLQKELSKNSIEDKILDPNYRVRINNIKWRNNSLLSLVKNKF